MADESGGKHEKKGRHRQRDNKQRELAREAAEDAKKIIKYAEEVTRKRLLKPKTKKQQKKDAG